MKHQIITTLGNALKAADVVKLKVDDVLYALALQDEAPSGYVALLFLPLDSWYKGSQTIEFLTDPSQTIAIDQITGEALAKGEGQTHTLYFLTEQPLNLTDIEITK